ncbi:MAG: ABC transporter substrate-binding protein [Thermodesulfobacteriota bacterium]
MKKGVIFPQLAIAAVAFLIFSLSAIPAMGQQKIIFSTPIRTAVHADLPSAAAEQQGFWKQMGLNVQWIPFGSGRAQSDALAAGASNAGMTLSTSGIRGSATGIPIMIVADVKLRNDFFVWVPVKSRIRKPRDLKGTKIGVPRLGSAAHAYGTALGKKLGLGKEMRIVGTGGVRAAVAGLRKGAIDGVLLTQFIMFRLKHTGVVRDLVSLRDYLPKQWMDNVIVARKDFAAQRPSDLKKLLKGYKLATKFVMKNPDWAVNRMKTNLRYTESAARAIFPLLRWGDDWKTDPKALKNVRDFLVEYGILRKSPKLETLYSNEFVS